MGSTFPTSVDTLVAASLPTDLVYPIASAVVAVETDYLANAIRHVNGNQNVGVGAATPHTTLDVNGTVRAMGQHYDNAGVGVEMSYLGGGLIESVDRGTGSFQALTIHASSLALPAATSVPDPSITGNVYSISVPSSLPDTALSTGKWRHYKATADCSVGTQGDVSLIPPGGTVAIATMTLKAGDFVSLYCTGALWYAYSGPTQLANVTANATWSTTATGWQEITPVKTAALSCSGCLLRVDYGVILGTSTAASFYVGPTVDTSVITYPIFISPTIAGTYYPVSGTSFYTPAAGSHTFAVDVYNPGGTVTLYNGAFCYISVTEQRR